MIWRNFKSLTSEYWESPENHRPRPRQVEKKTWDDNVGSFGGEKLHEMLPFSIVFQQDRKELSGGFTLVSTWFNAFRVVCARISTPLQNAWQARVAKMSAGAVDSRGCARMRIACQAWGLSHLLRGWCVKPRTLNVWKGALLLGRCQFSEIISCGASYASANLFHGRAFTSLSFRNEPTNLKSRTHIQSVDSKKIGSNPRLQTIFEKTKTKKHHAFKKTTPSKSCSTTVLENPSQPGGFWPKNGS